MSFYSCGMDIEYSIIGPEDLDSIRILWEKLRDHHASIAPGFGGAVRARNFEQRKQELLKKTEAGDMQIIAASDAIEKSIIGYCIVSVTGEGEGEIDSLFVEESYRGREIGDRLMEAAAAWLDAHAAESAVLHVMAGNEAVLDYYRRHGFYLRGYILQRGKPGEPEK